MFSNFKWLYQLSFFISKKVNSCKAINFITINYQLHND